jgi:hypothetical protein
LDTTLDLTLFWDFKIVTTPNGTGYSGKKKTTGFNVGIIRRPKTSRVY